MKIICSSNNKHACSDFNIEVWYQDNKGLSEVYVATCVQFDRLRVAQVEGDIIMDQVKYGARVLTMSKGKMDAWPDGFFDHTLDFLSRIS